MKIISDGNMRDIPIKVYMYNTFFKRLRGLMFRLKPIQSEAILLTPCNSIHMFFMFFKIDVLFLNKNSEIVYMKDNVKPWTVIFPKSNAHSVLELPANTIRKYSIQTGDKITF